MHPAKYGLPGIFCWSAPQAHQGGIAYSLSVLGVCPIMVLQPIVCSGCYSDCRQSQCFTVEDACSIDGKESQTGKAEYVVNLKTTRTAGSLNPLLDTQTVKLQNFNGEISPPCSQMICFVSQCVVYCVNSYNTFGLIWSSICL